MKESHLKTLENSAQIFNALAVIPGEVDDMDMLLEVSVTGLYVRSCIDCTEFKVAMEVGSKISIDMIQTYRRRHLAYLMADQGALVGNPDSTSHLPKQHLARYFLSLTEWVIFFLELFV